MSHPTGISPRMMASRREIIFSHLNDQKVGGLKKPYVNHRALHSDPFYENPQLLLSQKFQLTRDIEQIRSENDKYKKEISELKENINRDISQEIEERSCVVGNEQYIDWMTHVQNAKQKISELQVELNELTTQYDFLYSYFNARNENDLLAYKNLQAHQKEQDQSELDEMDSVLRKAINRLNGPIEASRYEYEQSRQTIMAQAKYLEKLILEEKSLFDQIDHFYDDCVLPEELLVVLQETQHNYDVLQHRHFNRRKEYEKMKQLHQQRIKATAELKKKEPLLEKERQERERFRRKMKTRKMVVRKEAEEQLVEIKKQQKVRSATQRNQYVDIQICDDEDLEEKWRMLTFVREARED